MQVPEILQLGDERLYQVSEPVVDFNTAELAHIEAMLHAALLDFRARYKAGRAIAAPQIGVFKRIIYMNIGEPVLMINPVLYDFSDETFQLWDDCMCFPHLHVRVSRHKSCTLSYRDIRGQMVVRHLTNDLSELIQHEYDHLDGILATMRAVDKFAFRTNPQL